jgi:hypothetical protein
MSHSFLGTNVMTIYILLNLIVFVFEYCSQYSHRDTFHSVTIQIPSRCNFSGTNQDTNMTIIFHQQKMVVQNNIMIVINESFGAWTYMTIVRTSILYKRLSFPYSPFKKIFRITMYTFAILSDASFFHTGPM